MKLIGSQALAIATESREHKHIYPAQIYAPNLLQKGTVIITFGPFPGSPDTSFIYDNMPYIGANAIVEAWIFPLATADHSADEHWVNPPKVFAGNVVAGKGFTIYGQVQPDKVLGGGKIYGQWTVAWCWRN